MENTLYYFWVVTAVIIRGLDQPGRVVCRVVCRGNPVGYESNFPGPAKVPHGP